MALKPPAGSTEFTTKVIDQQNNEVKEREFKQRENEEVGSSDGVDISDVGDHVEEKSTIPMNLPNKKLSDWEARRYGSMAARLLRDVKIT